ncbi:MULTISPECIES: hypothetical protein [unclassified Roseovarius]|uniref:hypothetical protein n=1 Tax=unclassified Roseovarius TaxID=2614913 RepID=UPI00273E2838|nr:MULTISPECIES: hypothetical protein [unclassified Roseovarius]
MFRKRSEKQIRDLEDGERFARTAAFTFVLVYLAYPIFLMAKQNSHTDPTGNLGGFVFLIWFFGLGLAAKMFFFGMIAGALSFFPIYRLLSYKLEVKLSATLAASVAAYVAIVVSYHIGIEFSPFGFSWNADHGAYAFSRDLGIFAAIVALPIARIMWIGAHANA